VSDIVRPPTSTHTGLDRARAIRLLQQATLSDREAALFDQVGATRAAKHWRKRAARLRARAERPVQ